MDTIRPVIQWTIQVEFPERERDNEDRWIEELGSEKDNLEGRIVGAVGDYDDGIRVIGIDSEDLDLD